MQGLPNLIGERSKSGSEAIVPGAVQDTFFRIRPRVDRVFVRQRYQAEEILRLCSLGSMVAKCQVAGNAEGPRFQVLLGLFLLNVAEQAKKHLLDNLLAFGGLEAERQQISEEGEAQFVEELNDPAFSARRRSLLRRDIGL